MPKRLRSTGEKFKRAAKFRALLGGENFSDLEIYLAKRRAFTKKARARRLHMASAPLTIADKKM